MANELSGECHCGNIAFSLHTEKQPEDFTPRQCSCTLCRKHSARWISDPEGTVHISYKDRELISSYRFGHQTADFILCARCGVLMAALCDIDGQTHAVLNLRAMQEEVFTAAPLITDFDDEGIRGRLARRAHTWTGNVIFIEAGNTTS